VNPSGVRKAALALATMHPTDRSWMLSRMPVSWRSALKPLIGEACRFTDIDVDLLQKALDGPGTAPTTQVPSPAVLIGVLDGLPGPWAARVLTSVAADHTEIYLAACSRTRGEAIRHDMKLQEELFPRALAQSLGRCLEEAGRALKAGESR
jgi:hypothetical protein